MKDVIAERNICRKGICKESWRGFIFCCREKRWVLLTGEHGRSTCQDKPMKEIKAQRSKNGILGNCGMSEAECIEKNN